MGAYYLYSSIFLACFGCFVSATVMVWSSPMVEKLQKMVDNPLGRPITQNENSLLASLSILGSFSGCIAISLSSSRFGRKTLLFAQGLIIFLFYSMMAWAGTIWILYLGRFMTGVGVGGVLSTMPIYFGELAEAKNRGLITTTIVISMNGGMLFSYAAGPYCSYFIFHLMLASFAAIYSALFFVFALESPYHTIKYDTTKTKEILRKLRGDDKVEKTLKDMEDFLRHSSKASFMDVFNSKASVRTLIIGIGAFFFTQSTGATVVSSYTQSILTEAGGAIRPEDGTIIMNVVQLITSIIISMIADMFPRKILLVFSHVGISLSQIPLGIYFHLKYNEYDGLDNLSWLPLTCMIAYLATYSVGVGPIYNTFMSELFSPKIKNVVVSWLIAYNLVLSFLITWQYNNLEEAIGLDYLLWGSAICGFIAVIFVRLCTVETKGKTLQEIQDELNARYN